MQAQEGVKVLPRAAADAGQTVSTAGCPTAGRSTFSPVPRAMRSGAPSVDLILSKVLPSTPVEGLLSERAGRGSRGGEPGRREEHARAGWWAPLEKAMRARAHGANAGRCSYCASVRGSPHSCGSLKSAARWCSASTGPSCRCSPSASRLHEPPAPPTGAPPARAPRLPCLCQQVGAGRPRMNGSGRRGQAQRQPTMAAQTASRAEKERGSRGGSLGVRRVPAGAALGAALGAARGLHTDVLDLARAACGLEGEEERSGCRGWRRVCRWWLSRRQFMRRGSSRVGCRRRCVSPGAHADTVTHPACASRPPPPCDRPTLQQEVEGQGGRVGVGWAGGG